MSNRDPNLGMFRPAQARLPMIFAVVLAATLPGTAGSQTSAEQSARLAEARAKVESAEAALAQGELLLLQYYHLNNNYLVSFEEVERTRAKVELLEADLEAATSSLRMTELAGTEPETTVVVPASPGIVEAIIDELPELPERSPFK